MGEVLSDSNSTLPWSWVIEALAKSPLVNTSILYGLLSEGPPLLGVSGKEAREAIALRCLERLLNSPNALNDNVGVSDLSEIRFDLSESCEVALQRITSGSKGSSNELNSDLELFIKHKKSSLSKSTLEMLNETISDGTNPLFSFLKEIDGLDDVQENQDQSMLNVPFDGGDPTSPPSKIEDDDHDDRIMLSKENGYSSRSSTSTHGTDNHVQEIDVASNYDHCPPSKKLKMIMVCGTESKQDHLVPLGGNEMLNGIEDGHVNQVNKTIEIHDEKSNGKDESVDQQHISPNNGGDRYQEEVDIAFNKSTNLSSLCGVTKDSLAMTESQPNMCMKCNKDGQLLSCSGSSCALLFHETCLGCSISFDDIGNFYCPFCAYSRAISEYVRAKERVSLARKNLSLFIGGRPGDPPEQTGNTSSGDDVIKDALKNADRTVKKGTNSITNDAKTREASLKGKSLEISRSSTYLDANGLVLPQHLSIKDAQGAEIIIRLSQGPARDYRGCGGARICDKEQIENGNVIIAELKRKSENTRCKITEIHGDGGSESISDSISDSDELVQYKTNDGMSSLPFPKPLREVPRWRRKKVPWTAEEEAMLKKGVETFVQTEGQVIPWKAILEYGGSVFHPGRTPIDLKDKWRNITGRGTSPKVK